MRNLLLILLVTSAFVIESRMTVFGAGLNLTVLFAYWAGLRYGPSQGVLAGATLGAVADSVSGGMLGPYMLSKATAGYMASHLRGGLFMWSPFLGLMGVMIITGVDGLIAYACHVVFEQSATPVFEAAGTIFWQSALNCWAGLLLRPEDEQH